MPMIDAILMELEEEAQRTQRVLEPHSRSHVESARISGPGKLIEPQYTRT
jgi:hypothetical protein